jgi:naked cuticle
MTNDENKMNKSNKRTPKKSVNSEVKNANTNKNPQVATGHTSSPHYLRHRNRQEDQARAMAQVVRWLEQEFSSNLNMKDKTKSNHFTQSTYKEKNTGSAPSTPNSGVERHEHHHVHEHIHHHYHHYQETPLVV